MPNTLRKREASTPLQLGMGLAVKQLRGELGLSQEEYAYRADLDRSYIAAIERGGRNPTLRSVALLAKGFNVSPLSLFTLAHTLSGKG